MEKDRKGRSVERSDPEATTIMTTEQFPVQAGQ